MTMGIFGDLDLSAASDDPFKIEDGTYEAVITKAEVKRNKADTDNFLVLTYTIDDGTKRQAQEWKKIPSNPSADDYERSKSYLKQRLLSIGIPNERINAFEPDDAIGTEVVITVKENSDGFPNINKVVLASDAGGSTDTGSAGNAFASL
jgi:hypothetical protein